MIDELRVVEAVGLVTTTGGVVVLGWQGVVEEEEEEGMEWVVGRRGALGMEGV